jgi:predicted Zn-dependent protease
VCYRFPFAAFRTKTGFRDLSDLVVGTFFAVNEMKRIPLPKAFFALATAFLVLLAGTSEAQFSSTRSEVERESRLQWLRMKREMPRPSDPQVQRFVECVSYSLIAQLSDEYEDLDWEVIVFDDDSTNAFAMPGGKIGVFTGIFKVATTVDALATVIGHEIAHLTEDHVMERARKQLGTDLLAGVLSSATYGYGRDSIQQGTQIFLSLPFDRAQESEADVVGLEFMAAAGYDPRASLRLWRNMSELGNGAPPEWLSTHPSDDRRMADLASSLAPALVAYNESLEANGRPRCM